MVAPTIVASVVAATANQVTAPAPSGTGGRLVFIAAHDTGSTEPFGIPNDFGPGTVVDETGHLISHYTAMPAAANVLQVWSKPADVSEPSSYVLDVKDAASGGSALSRATIFVVARVTHPDGVPELAAAATAVNDAGSANEPVNPSVTTPSADNLVAYLVGWDEGKTLSSGGAPAGTTELFHSDQTLHDLLLNTKAQASAGPSGTGAWNISSGTRWCAATLAFAPPSGGGADQLVEPAGIAAAGGVGSPTVQHVLSVQPAGIAPAGGVGSPTLALNIAPASIAPAGGVGAPSLALTVSPAGIAAAGGVGSPSIGLTVSPASIEPGGGVGSPVVSLVADQLVEPVGIAPSGGVGVPEISFDWRAGADPQASAWSPDTPAAGGWEADEAAELAWTPFGFPNALTHLGAPVTHLGRPIVVDGADPWAASSPTTSSWMAA